MALGIAALLVAVSVCAASSPSLKLLQITGHFDDPAAKDCALPSATIGEGTGSRLTCRTHFVVKEVT
jgi:hypothetical protein